MLKHLYTSEECRLRSRLADGIVGHEIFRRLKSASDFLEPTKSAGYFGYIANSLENTRPIFRGTWVFHDPASAVASPRVPVRRSGRPSTLGQQRPSHELKSPPTRLLVVQIDWTDDEEGCYEKAAPRFYQLDQGKLGPKKHMDINLLELGE